MGMNVNSFFKILNRKINNYDKLAVNPFIDKHKMVIVWVEESDSEDFNSYNIRFPDKKDE